MNLKVEFLYEKKRDKTLVYLWKGQQIVDKLELEGLATKYIEGKVTTELKEKYKKKEEEQS